MRGLVPAFLRLWCRWLYEGKGFHGLTEGFSEQLYLLEFAILDGLANGGINAVVVIKMDYLTFKIFC